MTTDALLVQAFQALGHELPELAVELFEKVLHQEPGNPAVLLEIARCHLLRSCRGQAITALEKAEHADLDDLELHLELGRVWRQAGDADRACHWFRTIPPGTQWHGAALLEECLLKERQEEASFPENLARERWAGAPPYCGKWRRRCLPKDGATASARGRDSTPCWKLLQVHRSGWRRGAGWPACCCGRRVGPWKPSNGWR